MNRTCTRCRRPLRNSRSVVNGMGPVCWKKHLWEKERESSHNVLLQIDTDDVVLQRRAEGVATNVPHAVVRHSPTGFEWGYGGSGPADLALNILIKFGLSQDDADRLHQKFKFHFIGGVPKEGGTIKADDIRAWIADQMAVKS